MVVIALVIGQVVHGVDGADRIACDFIHRTVDGGNTGNPAAVVGDRLNGTLGSKAGGDGSHQHQNMLAADHGLDVVPENDLGIGIVFGLHNVDGLVGIDGTEAGLGQFVGDAGTQNSGAVQTQNGIHGSVIDEVGNQLISTGLGLRNTGLLEGDINVVIDMGVIGHKVALGNTQGDITLLDRQFHKLDHGHFLHFF